VDDEYLYLQIASSIRRDIANGLYKPGDMLPTIRSYSETWHCTIGTVQRAIQKLASQGIVSTHIGKGTKVVGSPSTSPVDTLRQANLIHRAETFLLDVITSGYTTAEVEDAFKTAVNRWRSVSQSADIADHKTIRFAGSHDLAVAWLATHFSEIAPGYQMHLSFSGSVSGLMALAEGKCDIAGSHLYDIQTGNYNTVFLNSIFPNEKHALVTLAQRRLGLIVKPGNPKHITSFKDLTREGVRFINRHAGSGTRVFLDSELKKLGINANQINGYGNQKKTHTEVAAEIADGSADVGLGLEAAAKSFNLDFVFITLERYDLVMKQETLESKPMQCLVGWLKSQEFHTLLEKLGGYDATLSGTVLLV
jgi:putative molybdopterin biosynthesis protein